MLENDESAEIRQLIKAFPFSEEILVQMEHAWNKLKISSFLPNHVLVKPSFSEMITKAYTLYYNVLAELESDM